MNKNIRSLISLQMFEESLTDGNEINRLKVESIDGKIVLSLSFVSLKLLNDIIHDFPRSKILFFNLLGLGNSVRSGVKRYNLSPKVLNYM